MDNYKHQQQKLKAERDRVQRQLKEDMHLQVLTKLNQQNIEKNTIGDKRVFLHTDL